MRDESKIPKRAYRARKPGRPRTAEEVRALVLRLAKETDWGCTRIHGELQKLGVKISRRSVANILSEAGVPHGSARGESTWNEFLKAHAQTLWACDFVAKKVLTWHGWKDAYLLVLMSRAGPSPPESMHNPSTHYRICCHKRLGGVLKHYYRRAV